MARAFMGHLLLLPPAAPLMAKSRSGFYVGCRTRAARERCATTLHDFAHPTRLLPRQLCVKTGGNDAWCGITYGNARLISGNVRRMRVLPAPALVAQREVNDEARSDRHRKRGHFGHDRWGGDGGCAVLPPLRPCASL